MHCLFNWSLIQRACRCMWTCDILHTHAHTHTHTHTYTQHTWPSITVCLPLRQQMLQPCHNSLAVWNQTVSLGPLGSNLLTPQSAPLTVAYHGLTCCLLRINITLDAAVCTIKVCKKPLSLFEETYNTRYWWEDDWDLYFSSLWMCSLCLSISFSCICICSVRLHFNSSYCSLFIHKSHGNKWFCGPITAV